MTTVAALTAAELARPVDPRVAGFAQALAADYGPATRAVLFYGSCLRTTELDGQMLDFYVIVSDYREAYAKGWLARANAVLPPNVFPHRHDGLAAKVAILSAADFARLCGPQASDVSVFARFAQPARLVWTTDAAAARTIESAVADAPRTLIAATRSVAPDDTDPVDLFRRGFALTYGCELRAERAGRSDSVVDHDPAHYRALGTAILAEKAPPMPGDGERLWARWRRRGKRLTLMRLAKASLTYAGGIDYLAWKINRHAGTAITLKPWQRRWPILGAITLLPKLLASGAVK